MSTPVVIGVGQVTDRNDDPAEARDPLALITDALARAAEDANLGNRTLAEVDAIDVVNVVSWLYDDIAGQVAAAVGARPRHAEHSAWGGNQPTQLLERSAERVAKGDSHLAVVCGGEAFRSMEKGLKSGHMPTWPPPPAGAEGIDVRAQVPPAAWDHGLRLPSDVYPLYENAYRHTRGQSLAESQHWSARLWSRMSAVAAENPGAWLREPRSPDDIETVSAGNRMVAFPYPKLMNALLSVNQAGAVIVADTETAARLGVPETRWVYVWGGAGAQDPEDILARVGYDRSPSMEASLDDALAVAGVDAGAVDAWELYSCFPCVPKMALDVLGLPADTDISVTGGLTFFGGPANAYMLHAIDAMTRRIRERDGTGLLYGQGGFVTKHHALVLAREPRDGGYPLGGAARDGTRQAAIGAQRAPDLETAPRGGGVVESFTALYGREGTPERGIVVGRLDGGARFVANTVGDDTDRLVSGDDVVGAPGRVEAGEGGNIFRL
jgi:hypothetical protein